MKKINLTELIKNSIIKKNGISLSEYMKMCMTHPKYGYYTKKYPIGFKGDFITSPEISQMFGELIGLWIVKVWMDHGKPSNFSLVELGPGNGTLMAAILRATKNIPEFHKSLKITLVEISPALQKLQKKVLKNYQINWKNKLNKLPNIPTTIIANEFFDAFPIEQYIFKKSKWLEIIVSLKNFKNKNSNEFCFGLKKIAKPPEELSSLNNEENQIYEVSPEIKKNIIYLSKHLKKNRGACLIIDYGKNNNLGSTLQSIKNHKYSNPLENQGESDLTSLVNFRAIKDYAENYNLVVTDLVDQGDFLNTLGIQERFVALSKNMEKEKIALHLSSLKRLIDKNQMGKLFKVIGIRNRNSLPLVGLEHK